MKRLIGCVLLLGALLACPMAVHAQQQDGATVSDDSAARLALSTRFIALLQTDQITEMMSQMTTAITPPRPGLSQAENDAIRTALRRSFRQMMPRIFDAMAPVYADIFTLEELTGLVAFYESDIGRSMMSKSYAAAPRISAIVVGMIPELVHEMAETMCKELDCSAQERAAMDAALAEAGYPRPGPVK